MGKHECDDGNLDNGDGCNSECKVEQGFNCVTLGNLTDYCFEICGDGLNLGHY
jgi:cysteine-rich repeat protein